MEFEGKMHVEYYKEWSDHLQRNMEFKVYGHAGRPVLVFASGGGKFYEFEDFGMVEAVRWFIEQGKIQLYTIDSVDQESWLGPDWVHPEDKGRRHNQYERYIIDEFIPLVHDQMGEARLFMTTGCSMGACHAANFYFKHPDLFDGVISLSGLYGPWYFVGDYVDDNVYFNFPLLYLPNLRDPWYLDRYRESDIIICVGQGAWEDSHIEETRALEDVLRRLEVGARVEYWGHDVRHDWPWWQKQLPYFLSELEL
jgi:esterase/lipase superfamily enzyme